MKRDVKKWLWRGVNLFVGGCCGVGIWYWVTQTEGLLEPCDSTSNRYWLALAASGVLISLLNPMKPIWGLLGLYLGQTGYAVALYWGVPGPQIFPAWLGVLLFGMLPAVCVSGVVWGTAVGFRAFIYGDELKRTKAGRNKGDGSQLK